jgi:hypothetical protein
MMAKGKARGNLEATIPEISRPLCCAITTTEPGAPLSRRRIGYPIKPAPNENRRRQIGNFGVGKPHADRSGKQCS